MWLCIQCGSEKIATREENEFLKVGVPNNRKSSTKIIFFHKLNSKLVDKL